METTLEAFEIRFRKWIRAERRAVLSPLSGMYKAGVHLRNWLYDRGWLDQKRGTLPVVSIGNIVAGGSGKTQVILLLAQELMKTLKVAVLSRGYRSLAEKRKDPLHVDPIVYSPKICGDESWMVAQRLKEVIVIAGKNRYAGANLAATKGAEVVLLDDGMQHRRLHRDMEIVVIDSEDPFGGGDFLPQGLLREDPKRLKVADLIVFIGQPSQDLRERTRSLSQAPWIQAEIRPDAEMADLEGAPVGLFCAIGHPERFVRTVSSLGCTVVSSHFFPDHAHISKKALEKFSSAAAAKGARFLVCTEKDKVKLSEFELELSLPVRPIKAELRIVENQKTWESAVAQVKRLARRGS